MNDRVTLSRVANGWVIQPGPNGPNDFTHVALTPDYLADHVRKWAAAQTSVTIGKESAAIDARRSALQDAAAACGALQDGVKGPSYVSAVMDCHNAILALIKKS